MRSAIFGAFLSPAALTSPARSSILRAREFGSTSVERRKRVDGSSAESALRCSATPRFERADSESGESAREHAEEHLELRVGRVVVAVVERLDREIEAANLRAQVEQVIAHARDALGV